MNLTMYDIINDFSLRVGLLAAANDGSETNQTGIQLFEQAFYGNELWRFGLLLLIILVTLVAGRIMRYMLERSATRLEARKPARIAQLFLACLARPAAVAIFAAGVYLARLSLKFALAEGQAGFSPRTYKLWGQISHALAALAVAYLLYRLVDIIEHYLLAWAQRTETTLGTMLVPAIRKSIRVFIILVAALFIADNILGQDIRTILAAAGIGGLALALAAKDTIANLFGSVTIFADRPFQIGERVRVGKFDGPIESVGFRSTRIRTLDGHQVTVPNSTVVNEMVENIGRRPYIRRLSNISITYSTPPAKAEKAVQIIKDVLAGMEAINGDPDLPPRVYFNEFQDYYLNILMLYWFKPPNYWDFQEINQKVNLAIMRAFETEGIEFAFPTKTVYIKKSNETF